MTNGEKIKELFPNFDVEDKTEYFGRVRNLDDHFIKADIEWWNAEYKEPTTKNDLVVDCISRKAVLDAIDSKAWEFCDYLISKGRNDEQKPVSHFADNLRECVREEMSSVTPQEPKTGHWIEEFNDLEGEVRFTCSSCGKYQLFGTDFCYHCGSDNREAEE